MTNRDLGKALWLLLLPVGYLSAQDTIAGRVISRRLAPIAGARVSNGDDTAMTTDSAGRFVLPRGTSGRLQVRALGYTPLDTNLTEPFTDGEPLLFVLREVQTLPTVDVLASGKPARYASTTRFDEFYERRSRQIGKYFTREDIDRRNTALIVDVLRDVPGVRVIQAGRGVPLSLRFARCTAALGGVPAMGLPHADKGNKLVAVFVDGTQLHPDHGVEFLDGMKTGEVEAMEVYQGASQLPSEARGNACAAIYIWTRFSSADTVSRRSK